MEIKKNITINLSEDDLKKIVADYLQKDGYSVKEEDVSFSVGRQIKGYGMQEYEELYFKGCNVKCSEK